MTVAKGSQTLHFEKRGSGLPLLLIHGFPFSGQMWYGQLDALSSSANLIVPDLPGFGASPAASSSTTVDQYAQQCIGVLDSLDIMEPFVLGGLSMGGYIALAASRLMPLRIKGLMLISTRAGADSEEGKANRDKTIANVKENGASVVSEAMYPKLLSPETYKNKPEVAEQLKDIMKGATPEGVIAALSAMRDRPDSTELLSDLHMPVLIIHGKDDQVIPPSEAEAMNKAIPQSTAHIIEKAGHLPNLEQTEEFNTIITKFLAKLA